MMKDSNFFKNLFTSRKVDMRAQWLRLSTAESIGNNDLKRFCSEVTLNDEDFTKRKMICEMINEMLNEEGFYCKVYCFGSSVNGLGMFDSDLDFHIRLIDPEINKPIQLHHREACKNLQFINRVFRKKFAQFFTSIFIRCSCPIVKLVPRDSKLISSDLNISNPFGIYNSIFINFLCEFCPRFQQVTVILRYWAKLNDLICYSGMNSYTFTILIIFFFQHCQIFSPIEEIGVDFSEHHFETTPEDFEMLIKDKCRAIVDNDKNPSNILELIMNFFRFYSSFDYVCQVISPRLGRALPKDYFESNIVNGRYDFMITSGVCIEDPFELDRNIAKNVKFYKLIEFVNLCTTFGQKDITFFRKGSNLRQFLTKKPQRSSPLREEYFFLPCKCTIKEFLEAEFGDEDFCATNILAFLGEKIMAVLNQIRKKPVKIRKFKYEIIDFNLDSSRRIPQNQINFGDFHFLITPCKKQKKSRERNISSNSQSEEPTTSISATNIFPSPDNRKNKRNSKKAQFQKFVQEQIENKPEIVGQVMAEEPQPGPSGLQQSKSKSKPKSKSKSKSSPNQNVKKTNETIEKLEQTTSNNSSSKKPRVSENQSISSSKNNHPIQIVNDPIINNKSNQVETSPTDVQKFHYLTSLVGIIAGSNFVYLKWDRKFRQFGHYLGNYVLNTLCTCHKTKKKWQIYLTKNEQKK